MTEHHSSEKRRRVELLAPAGSMERLHAAVEAGADAVYLGLDDFNARRNADNFTIEALSEACDYAHLRGVAVYVTLNIEILPSEIGRAVDLAKRASQAGADAFIVQDLGLAARIREEVPQAELHISTQMNIHSVAGIQAAARLGASRVTLARELSFAQIKLLSAAAAQRGMVVETFAHGALCVCYSGQCLMSSLIGGRSANRGLCAQACRLPYELQSSDRASSLPAPGEHLLSPRDLCTAQIMPEMVASGTSSLKIEGRMKSATYVYAVVSVYRQILDRALAGEDVRPTEAQMNVLSEVFSRGFTAAYLTGERGNDLMSYGRPNNRGAFVGRVAGIEGGVVRIDSERTLHAGDVIEFWTKRGHFAHTLAEGSIGADGVVRVSPDQKVGKGDRVFRVRNAETAYEDDSLEPRLAVRGSVALRLGRPARVEFHLVPNQRAFERLAQVSPVLDMGSDELAAFASPAGLRGVAVGPTVEPARTRPLCRQDVRDHIDRLGQTPFAIEHMDIQLDEGVGMGFSLLHRLRSEALDSLRAQVLDLYAGNHRMLMQAVDALCPASGEVSVPLSQPRRRSRVDEPLVVAWATNPSCARAAKRAGAQLVYIPALNYKRGEAALAGVRCDDVEQAGYPKQKAMAFPAVDHDPVEGTREHALGIDVWGCAREGKTVLADGVGSLMRAQELGMSVEVGPHVPLTNIASLNLAQDWGIQRVWLSPDLTLGQIADVAEGSSVPLGITVAGYTELMITEHCLLMSQGPCDQRCGSCRRRSVEHHLGDRKGFSFPVVTDALGRSHLYNGVELDIAFAIPDLLQIGVGAFMVDTTLLSKDEAHAAVSRVVRAVRMARETGTAIEKKRGATTGHLFRGVT
ncbi:U32 family peptidase [Berryella wangjianweii]|uniref:U32 family peptidase n=2 Tax=Berryella wangjianweii TaxID=2734634 RepID=A0A6M8J2A8_9ACTN|nr:U32 family peptidase [Berryella wangjianweii]